MNRYFNIVILFASLALHFQVNAQTKSLTFGKVLSDGFENNYDIKLKKLSFSKTDYTLLKATGALNPLLSTELVYGSGVNPSLDNDGTQTMQTKLVLPTKFGIDFYSGFRLERTIEYGSTSYAFNGSGAFAGVKIPLLRGIGKTSPLNTEIEISKINKKVIGVEYSNQILTFFTQILSNYITLKEAKDEYDIVKKIVSESKKYRDEIFILVENDQLPLTEKNRANSNYYDKLQKLTISNIQVLQVYYETKNLLGIDNDQKSDSIPELLDAFPEPKKEKINAFIDAKIMNVDTLIKSTPQYKSIALGVSQSEILLKNAKNQKKNSLDLDFRISSFGSFINGQYDLTKTFNSTPGTSFLVSLTHDFPIRNQQKKGAYLEKLVEYDISQTHLKQYLFESSTSVRLNLKLLKQKTDLFYETKILVNFMKKNYEDEQEKFKLGNSTQTDIIIALDNYFDAYKSLNNLKYEVWKLYIEIKFRLGELPKNVEELNQFLLFELFS